MEFQYSISDSVPGAAIMGVDIGDSTRLLLHDDIDERKSVETMAHVLLELFAPVLRHGGRIIGFTGDGFLAMFEPIGSRSDPEVAGVAAFTAAQEIKELYPGILSLLNSPADESGEFKLTLRVGIHWGAVTFINLGRDDRQAIGRDIVCAARLTNALTFMEDWTSGDVIIGISHPYYQTIKPNQSEFRELHRPRMFKGLPKSVRIFVHHTNFPGT